jgi:hypothetical protein
MRSPVISSHQENRRAEEMPRYFSNVLDGSLSFTDERGKELSSLHDAHLHALRILEKMLYLIPDHVTANCKIKITLSSGETVLTVIHPALASVVDARKKAS